MEDAPDTEGQIATSDLIAWPPAEFEMPLRAPVTFGGRHLLGVAVPAVGGREPAPLLEALRRVELGAQAACRVELRRRR